MSGTILFHDTFCMCSVCVWCAVQLIKIGKVYKNNIILKLSLTNNTDDDDAECNYKLCTDLSVQDCCRSVSDHGVTIYTV